MNSPKEIYAPLKHSVPVIITYYTAWVDETGKLNVRDDIYGHDAETAEKLYTGLP
jgi:murein L,D-transpeptidase YcbB/YkuD